MKKNLSVLLGITTLLFSGSLAACQLERPGTYTLDYEDFESTLVYQSEISYEGLSILRQMPDGTQTEIVVTESMFATPIDTQSVGEKQAVIVYGADTLTLDYSVKYQVQFAVDDEIVSEQFALTMEDVVFPETPEKEGYEFVSWGDVLPEELTDNLILSAIFVEEEKVVQAPALTELEAEYGDLLSSVTLPANEDGAWEFVDAANQTVGEVGQHEMLVQFVLNDGNNTVHTMSSVLLNVEKKYVKLTVVGEYEIELGETVPTVQYTAVDENGEAFDEAMKTLMGITVNVPQATSAGEYDITFRVENPNFEVEEVKGILTVNKVKLDLVPQIASDVKAVYGNKLESVGFEYVPQGVWSWKNADTVISTANEFTATAVFTPNYLDYYETLEKEVILRVEKRKVTLSVTEHTFVYNGEAQSLKYAIDGVLDGDAEAFTVEGNTQQVNAGVYEDISLTIVSDKYEGGLNGLTLTIEKASAADFAKVQAQIGTLVWNNAYLQDLVLPSGYAWVDGSASLAIGNNAYEATFTPEDTLNYKTENGQLFVNVVKAEAKITAADATFTYQKDHAYAFAAIANHAEAALTYAYALKDGTPVDGLSDAGEYVITITLEESEHYTAASCVVNVTVNAVENTDEFSVYSATYLQTLGEFALPTSEYGVWTWNEGDEAKVGAAGTQTHLATFTPNDTKNYQSRSVEVKFSVAKKSVSVPQIQAKVYTGETLTADVAESEFYSIINNGGVEAGDYAVTLTLLDQNYQWSDGEETLVRTFTFTIEKATNVWTTAPALSKTSWTYGDEVATVSVAAKFGTVNVKYVNANGEEYTVMPTQAGSYKAQFSVVGTDNYNGLTKEITFTISKKTVEVPTLETESVTYDGNAHTAVVTASEYYTVDLSAATSVTNAGEYEITVTLNNENYQWSDGEEALAKAFTFTIEKATNVWTTAPALSKTSWTYGDEAAMLSVAAKFGAVNVKYVNANGEESDKMPTSAGSYKAQFSVADTDNYNGLTKEITFTISKKTVEVPTLETESVTYDGNAHTAVVAESEYYTVDLTNATDVENVGEYEITVTLNNENYQWSDGEETLVKAFTFTIEKATNVWTTAPALSKTSWTYGDEVATVSVAAKFGTVQIGYVINGETLEAFPENLNAGSYIVKFTVSETQNYNGLTKEIPFVVSKKMVEVPTLDAKTYTSETLTADVAASELYTVLENNGGVDCGSYNVILKLNDANNYCWKAPMQGAEDCVLLTFEIVKNANNAWTTAPALSKTSWTYGDEAATLSVAAKFGAVNVKYVDESGVESTEMPINAGSYTVKFEVVATDEYNGLTKEITFTISKKTVEVPTLETESVTYDGNAHTAVVTESEYYTVDLTNATDVENVGEYEITVTLNNENYQWSDGEEALVKAFTFTIEKATNAWTTAPALSKTSWMYGDEAATVNVAAKFGAVNVKYIDANGEEYTAMPTEVGSYKAQFSVVGTDNYNGLTKEITFTISKKTVEVPTLETESVTYDGNAHTAVVEESEYYTVDVSAATDVENVGEYEITVTLNNENYQWTDGDATLEKTFTFTIEKATNIWTTAPALSKTSWTYGDEVATVSVAAKFGTVNVKYVNANGEESDKMPTSAGSYKAQFSVVGTDNYNGLTKEIAFTISKKTVEVPTLETESVTYDGNTHTVVVAASEYYTVDVSAATDVENVGEYAVTVTLKNENYQWSDGEEALVKAFTFTIEKATNVWTTAPALSKTSWSYGDEAATVSVAAKFGAVNVKYVDENGEEYTVMPTQAGSYKAQFSVAGTDNYNGLTAVVAYTVNKRVVNVPTLSASTIVYDGAEHTPIAENAYYAISGDMGAVNIGSYSLTVTLINSSCVWNDDTTAAKNYSFEIVKGQANITSFTLSKPEWSYGDDAAVPSVETNSDGSIQYYFDTSANGAFTSTQMPTNAGVYYVKAVIASTDYFEETESAVLSFRINKSQVSLTAPTYNMESVYYENTVNPSTAYVTAPTAKNHLGGSVEGTFTYRIELGQAIADGCVDVTVTFTLKDTANYALSTTSVTAKIKVHTVAYISSTNYGSVESALLKATSGNAVWVTAGLLDAVIAQSCTIPSGVTLNIPILSTNTGFSNGMNNIDSNGIVEATLTTTDLSGMSLETNITLNAGVVLTNNGTLKIAGELSGGNGGGAYAGHTAGKYAKLTLDKNAQIVNAGTINCYGIIAEKTLNNGSKITNTGSIYLPFVVRDFRGGSYMQAVFNKTSTYRICPFNQFEFRNITAIVETKSGAFVYGYANLSAGGQQNAATVKLIGNTAEFLIALTSGASVITKYTPRVYTASTTGKVEPNNSVYSEKDGDTIAEGVMKFDFYGGATVSSMQLTVSGITVKTSDYHFPLTWRFDITFHGCTDGTNATYTMNNRYKMMAGAKLTIESGAIVTMSEMNVYTEAQWFDSNIQGGNLYVNRGDAALTVRGTLNVTTIGGKATLNGGVVNAQKTSITTYEAKVEKVMKWGIIPTYPLTAIAVSNTYTTA